MNICEKVKTEKDTVHKKEKRLNLLPNYDI
jgi:hypothetical protein